MIWAKYEPYEPVSGVQLAAFWGPSPLPRTQARHEYQKKMNEREKRREMLGGLLLANGLELRGTDAGLLDLNAWFIDNVQANDNDPGSLLPIWYSVVSDVSLFLGDTLIERCPKLSWHFYSGAGASQYKPVVMGFTKVPNPKYNVDFEGRVASYAHKIVSKSGSRSHFGKVNIRGTTLDLDRLSAEMPQAEVDPTAFVRWVKAAELNA